MTLSKLNQSLLLGLLALSVQTASAHGAWLAQRADQTTIVYGHGASDNAYKAEKITLLSGFDANNQPVSIEQQPTKNNVILNLPKETAYIGFILDNGYWSQDANGKWKNLPKDEVEGAKQGGHYLKNAISLLNATANVKPVKGLKLQIIPMTNPLTQKAGEQFEVQVLFDGKPLADAEITADYVNMSHMHDAKTDAQGKAMVTIRNQGLNVLSVGHTEKLKDNPKADKTGYNATLSFSFEHKH